MLSTCERLRHEKRFENLFSSDLNQESRYLAFGIKFATDEIQSRWKSALLLGRD